VSAEHALELGQVERFAHLAVHLVDEGDDGVPPRPAPPAA
jgi:hypothetical protein